jgi:hypothetical protein
VRTRAIAVEDWIGGQCDTPHACVIREGAYAREDDRKCPHLDHHAGRSRQHGYVFPEIAPSGRTSGTPPSNWTLSIACSSHIEMEHYDGPDESKLSTR